MCFRLAWNLNAPASASQMLGKQACPTTPSFAQFFFFLNRVNLSYFLNSCDILCHIKLISLYQEITIEDHGRQFMAYRNSESLAVMFKMLGLLYEEEEFWIVVG